MRALLTIIVAVAPVLAVWEGAGAQGVQDFHFSNFEADYYLSKDGEGRARLRVEERITAEFPEFDQNKGLARAIPATFDGHPVSFELESVTRNGQPEPIYARYTERGNEVIETGTDDYVHGSQHYEFIYTLRDVVRDAGGGQEFYWDVNGTEWLQPFDAVTARVHLDASVRDLFTGAVECFQGVQGSTAPCGDIDQANHTITFTSDGPLGPSETLSIVVGFAPASFELYSEGIAGALRSLGAVLALTLAIAAVGWTVHTRMTAGRGAQSRGRITPHYAPPPDISVLEAASVYRAEGTSKFAPALVVDLAVRGNVKILEFERKFLFFTSTAYSVELVHTDGLRDDELAFVQALFGSAEPGAIYTFGSRDNSLAGKLRKLKEASRDAVVEQGYRRKVDVGWTPYALAGVAAAIGGLVVWNSPADGFGEWRVFGLIAGGAGLVAVLLIGHGIRPLTDKGRAVYDQLQGLRKYIKFDEAHRLRALQGQGGAERAAAGENLRFVDLHERLLPYAILFGLEKSWVRELSVHYEEASRRPHWYMGHNHFNAANFCASINSMTSSISHVSSPSSGGGGAGGGGGGGGGGGR